MSIYIWLIVIIVIILFIYVKSYYKYQTQISILQTTLPEFNFDMLREKQPLVISDQIVSIDDIYKLWFTPNIVIKRSLLASELWHKNISKYLVICAETEGDVYLYPAGKPIIDNNHPDTNESLIAISLKPQQIVIVPFHWYYLINMKCNILDVHDYITYFLTPSKNNTT